MPINGRRWLRHEMIRSNQQSPRWGIVDQLGKITRVIARTFEYDSLPLAKAAAIVGRIFKACATRPFSRAVFMLRSRQSDDRLIKIVYREELFGGSNYEFHGTSL